MNSIPIPESSRKVIHNEEYPIHKTMNDIIQGAAILCDDLVKGRGDMKDLVARATAYYKIMGSIAHNYTMLIKASALEPLQNDTFLKLKQFPNTKLLDSSEAEIVEEN